MLLAKKKKELKDIAGKTTPRSHKELRYIFCVYFIHENKQTMSVHLIDIVVHKLRLGLFRAANDTEKFNCLRRRCLFAFLPHFFVQVL